MQWLAEYNDGTSLGQYNDQGEASSEQIDRSKLASFVLVSEDGNHLFRLHLEPEQRLIFRRRVEQPQGGSEQIVAYLCGWQQTIEGRNVQSLAWIFDEGRRVEWTGKFTEKHRWFYAPQLVRCELQEQLRSEHNGNQVAVGNEVASGSESSDGDHTDGDRTVECLRDPE